MTPLDDATRGSAEDALLRAVPARTRRVLLAGGDDDLAARLARDGPGREVVIWDGGGPGLNACDFDLVVTAPPLATPATLLGQRRLLRPGGQMFVLAANARHHARLVRLLGGAEPPPTPAWEAAALLRLFLEAGFAPDLAEAVPDACPPDLLALLVPVLSRLGVHPGRASFLLSASHFLVRAVPEPGPPADAPEPLTFAACVSADEVLGTNLLRSPCLAGDSPHQQVVLRGCLSAADGLREALARARHGVVVLAHQDVFLPEGWDRRFWHQWHLTGRLFGRIGIAGVYGAARRGAMLSRAGRVVDRLRLLSESAPLPAPADTLDELLLALPRDTPLVPDPELGFHLYGADLALQARQKGLAVAVLDALCQHDSATVELPQAFHASARVLARKWPALCPVATPCGWVGPAPTAPRPV